MSIRQAVELVARVARTVHYAHEHGILHRDIKPGNILLDQNGEPHLTDFGLARLVETESTITRTREALGTPSYMAPEQAVGNNAAVSSATDVYGLGAVLYQLLTGHPPFAGGTTYETIKLLLDTDPRPPRFLNPKIDRDLSTIYNLNFQPVMPVSLTKDINLITRPVIQLYNSVPFTSMTGKEVRTTAFGDWTQLELFSPANSGNWLLGIGPTFIFPTAGSFYTGQGKWQIGPAVVLAYMTKKYIIGVFPQQWWSYAGDKSRANTNQINIQPIANLFFDGGWNVGYSGNILADWEAPTNNRWTVPIGLGVGKVVKFGRLPVKISLAGQYMVTQPGPVGQRWNIQLQVTPVLPKLIKGVLFQ